MFGRCRRWGTSLLLLVVLALIAGMGCRKELPELFDRNNPPETFITSAPVESLFDAYKVHMHWHGEDRDGEIAYFLWAWTDSSDAWYDAWNPESNTEDRVLREGDFDATHLTTRTDSIFVLQANEDGGMSRDLSFNITAVDDQGRRDPVPARLYFNASVDERPRVIWCEEPYGELDPGVIWVGTAPETLEAGEPFACAFTGSTINGFVKGYQWNSGGGTVWFPLVDGQTGWSYQDPELAALDTIRLDFDNDITGDSPFMTEFYARGTFRVKAKCIDQAGVESPVNTSDQNPQGVITPILNGDPDTRLRPDTPVIVTYTTFEGQQDVLTPEVERVDTGEPGFHYRLAEPIPWGQDVRMEVHLQGWDYDDPLVVEDALMKYQLAYTWSIKNLNLLDLDDPSAFNMGSSIGRVPPGGILGGQENLGYGYHGESGWHFQMNIGPMDYEVTGYAIDYFGRVDGTPMVLEVQGGYEPVVDSIIVMSRAMYEGEMTNSLQRVNLDAVPEGETLHIDIGGQYFAPSMLNPATWMHWDPDSYTATFWPIEISPAPPPLQGTYHVTFRVYGHDDLRNGDSAQLAGLIWDMFDPDFENNAEQFAEGDRFYIEEGGYIQSWQYIDLDDSPEEGYVDITMAINDVVFLAPPDLSPIMGEDTPPWLGEKEMSGVFRNTYPSDRFTALIGTYQQSDQPMGSKGRASDERRWDFDIQYRNIEP